MSEYSKVFKELRYEVWKVSFLNAFLNAAIVFFASNIILTLIQGRYIYSIVPAVLVGVWSFYRKARVYTLRRIEEGNPEVAEILRTAHDNSDHDNLMVHALFLELMQKLETVSAGVFIKPQRTIVKLLAIAVLAFTPVLITSFTPFLIVANPLAGVTIPGLFNQDNPLAPNDALAEAGGERNLYGDRDVAVLGNERLSITTASGSGGVDFTKTGDAQGNQFRRNDYPLDVSAEEAEACVGAACKQATQAEADLMNEYSECQRTGSC